MEYCLIVDANHANPVNMSDLVNTELPVCVIRWPDDQVFLAQVKNWVVYLPDEKLRDCLRFTETTNCTVHLLAHPEARHSLRGFCYSSKREPFTEALLQRPSIAIDLLRCNGNLVLNKVVAGKAFNYQPGGHASNFWQRLKTVWHQFRHLQEYRPQVFHLSTDGKNQIETAAVGIASTGHVLNSSLSRSLLTENYANDGLFYSLVVAPRSLVQMLRHFVFESFSRGSRQPGFIGVLRVRNLQITSPEPFECRLDEQLFTTDLLELDIVEMHCNWLLVLTLRF